MEKIISVNEQKITERKKGDLVNKMQDSLDSKGCKYTLKMGKFWCL